MNILIICAFGASSNILKRKIAEELKSRNINGSVSAYSVEDLNDVINDKDIVLVAPQLRISLPEIEKEVNGRIPIQLIDSVDYGTMNAYNILNKITAILN